MTQRTGPVYETTFFVRHEIAAEFQAWLEQFVTKSLQHEGIESAHLWKATSGQEGVASTILQIG